MPRGTDRPNRGRQAAQIARRSYGFIHINKCGGRSVEAALGLPKFHADACRMIRIFGRADWDRMFTFAVVRNPFTRLVSLYDYRLRKRLGGTEIDFADWVTAVFAERDPRYALRPRMLRPCHDWLLDADNRIAVAQVVRLEELEAAWPGLCVRLGVDAPLPWRNAGAGPRDYDALYPTPARDIVRTAFAADFDAFGYGFPAPDG